MRSVRDIFLDAFLKICAVMNLFSSLKRKIEFHLKQLKTLLLFTAYDNRYFDNHRKIRRVFDYITATQTRICGVCGLSRPKGTWLIIVTSHNRQLKLSTQMLYHEVLSYSQRAVNFGNRPFPISLVPLFQNESKCETFHMKMSSACSFIFMQIKVIFIRMVSHLDSLCSRGTRELGNGLL